jgi:ParB family transcriptional regulator, chromosome partitioning protein
MSLESRGQGILDSVAASMKDTAGAAPVRKPGLGPGTPTAVGGFVANGSMTAKQTIENLQKENADLKSKLAQAADGPYEGILVRRLDPNRVKHSALADRNNKAFQGPVFDEFCELIRSTGGNEMAAAVRPLADDPNFDFEIIHGHRRHAACIATNTPFKAEIKTVNDNDLLNLMIIENKGHLPLSAFEKGMSYQKAIDSGIFSSGRALATKLNMKHSVMQRLLQYPVLPMIALAAFPDPREIREYWVAPMIQAHKADEGLFTAEGNRLIEEARKMPLSAKAIFHRLVGRKEGHQVIASGDKVVGSIRNINGRPAVVLWKDAPDELLAKLKALVVDWTSTHEDGAP